MSPTERDLRLSLAHDNGDSAFVADQRAKIDARPLAEAQHPVAIAGDDAARLVRLAEEALRARALAIAPAQNGARATLVAAVAGDDRNRLIAIVEFNDEDELRRAARWLAADIVIEKAAPELSAANDQPKPGEGSLSTESETP